MTLHFQTLSGEVKAVLQVRPTESIKDLKRRVDAEVPGEAPWVVAESEGEFAKGMAIDALGGEIRHTLRDKALWEAADGRVLFLRRGPSTAPLKLLFRDLDLDAAATVAESHLRDGDCVTVVRLQVPRVRTEGSEDIWKVGWEERGPPLEDGDIAAVKSDKNHLQDHRCTRQYVKCARDYTIHFCRGPELSTAVRSETVAAEHVAVLHRLTYRGREGVEDVQVVHLAASTLLVFEGGYPNGGECFADVHAPWGNCFTCCPREGSTIIEVPWR